MAVAPQYVSTKFPQSGFNPGGTLPSITPGGIYVADQPTLDALTAAAAAAGITLVFSTTGTGAPGVIIDPPATQGYVQQLVGTPAQLTEVAPFQLLDASTKANGALPAVDDNNNALTISTTAGQGAPTISAGAMVANPNSNSGYASYIQAPVSSGLTVDGKRITAEFTVSGNDAGATSICIGLWDHTYTAGGVVPQARVHCTIVPGTASALFLVWDGSGHNAQVGAAIPFVAPPYDGVALWRVTVAVDEEVNSVDIQLPDDSVVTLTAAQIAAAIALVSGWTAGTTVKSLTGKIAFVEHYSTTNPLTNIATFPKIVRFAAESTVAARTRRFVSPSALLRIVRAFRTWVLGQVAATVPTTTKYQPAAGATVAAPTAQAAIDSANVIVSGIYGPNGKSVITAQAYYTFTRGADTVWWQLFNGATALAGTFETAIVGTSGSSYIVYHEFVITGGTPGAAFTFNLRHSSVSGNADFRARDSSGAPYCGAILTATPA